MATINKTDILSGIRSDALDKLNLSALGAIQIGASEYAIPVTSVIDVENAPQRYAKIAISACNPTGTEKVPAFDIDAAVEDWQLEVEERERKAAEKAAAKAAKATKAEK